MDVCKLVKRRFRDTKQVTANSVFRLVTDD